MQVESSATPLLTTPASKDSQFYHRLPRRSVCQYINIHMDKMGWVVETPMN